ncbi:hypothetical protein LRP88_09752 [Fusarium phalaenopsidis]
MASQAPPLTPLPRYAQELLSTFSTALGEVALQPSTGGTFIVSITHQPPEAETASTKVLWDRREDGGFPETKELKRRVRDVVEPGRDLGHVDGKHAKKTEENKAAQPQQVEEKAVQGESNQGGDKKCEDC